MSSGPRVVAVSEPRAQLDSKLRSLAACTGTSCSSGKVAGLIFFATFAYYWTSQVLANLILCTLAGGIYGGWYYYGPRQADSGLPKQASLKAFVRASTLSLGSIAFGSLIVTFLELLRLIIQSFSQYEAGQGDSESRS